MLGQSIGEAECARMEIQSS